MPSQTKENYLKALYFTTGVNGSVSLSDLSVEMGVRAPTVNSMMKKLKEQGWVEYEKYKPLSLTKVGRLEAARIIRKHRLTEMYLVERMNFGWEEVHDIAEQVEHIKSDAFFDRMDEILEFPLVDPHGSPIPRKDGSIPERSLRRLSDCKVGEKVVLKALSKSSQEFLHFLNDKQIELGTELVVHKRVEFDGSMDVTHDNQKSTLSREATDRLLVE